ncbi:MAG TPA: enoyl-CoA hydratase [Acidimicrobiales bacterium]|nr:enoyl-CoA hydratase [Acidimicrobiales bacterium]
MPNELDCQVADRVAVLTLQVPERRNALSEGLITEIIAALDDLESRDDVGALVVTGAPPAFCAGGALGDLAAPDTGDRTRRERLRFIYEAFLRVARSPLPTVAAVNGPAVGAGMNLALACDVRIAGRSARFETRFLELGLHPGGGHTWMAQRIVGPQAVAATVLFGERLPAERAAAVGLVWSVVDDAGLLDAARAMAKRAAAFDPDIVRRAKRTMAETAAAADLGAAVDIELDAQVWSMGRPAFAEGITAQKRR